MKTSTSELGSETGETIDTGRRIESLDDITREIADRRVHAEFGESVKPETSRLLREVPDKIEDSEDFEKSARAHGIKDTEGLQGFATRPEDPAHVLRTKEVANQIATEGHEDLHRLTHPETLREASENPALKKFYEGVTEHLNEQAMRDLHEYNPGNVYPEQTAAARQLAGEVGEQALRDWYFKGELSEELSRALERFEQ